MLEQLRATSVIVSWLMPENFNEISLSENLVPYLVLVVFCCLSTSKHVNLFEVLVFNVGLFTLTLYVTKTEVLTKELFTAKLTLFDCDEGLTV